MWLRVTAIDWIFKNGEVRDEDLFMNIGNLTEINIVLFQDMAFTFDNNNEMEVNPGKEEANEDITCG